MFSRLFTRFLLASTLGALTSVLGAPVVERSEIMQRAEMVEHGGSATVQWSDASGNHIRNYHIRSDCTVIENSWGPGFTTWIANALPFCANSGGIVAVLFNDPSGGPETIQLFFRDSGNGNKVRSGIWQSSTGGWSHDTGINALNIASYPATAVAWRTRPGTVKNIRLYTVVPQIVEVSDHYADLGDIFEYSYTTGVGWTGTNQKLFRSMSLIKSGDITAVATPDGSSIRLFYWDEDVSNPFDIRPNKEFVNQAYWSQSAGWRVLGAPTNDLKDFHNIGPLVAVMWAGGNQIRLYVRTVTWGGTTLNREHVYSNGVWSGVNVLPGWTHDRVGQGQPSAVVWTHPDANNVHIRIYNSRCHAGGSCRAYIHEWGFDSSLGWNDGKNLVA